MSDPKNIKRRGLMLVLSSPSGAGKTTISRQLLELEPDLSMSVSATTRPARPGEVDGEDYFFITKEKFHEMVQNDEFLEHATVFENSYGTPRAPVEAALGAGKDVLFDVDWQGAQELRDKAITDLVSIFILPPSKDELERRLHARAQDPAEVIAKRMAKASGEMSRYDEYKYIVVNVDVDRSVYEVQSILTAERLVKERRGGLHGFVRALCGEDE
ncbi:MAG: guanylate kinase [Rhodospirillaceae bacterium]|nr:guanylate kinase [Rhodospirillaceae bacterium]